MNSTDFQKFKKNFLKTYRRGFRQGQKWAKQKKRLWTKWLKKNRQILAIVGLFIGLQLMILGGLYWWYQRSILSFAVIPQVVVAQEFRQPKPTQIKIESVGIDLPIAQASISGGTWQVVDQMANHLASSARPGERSNIVIYGHNRWSVFGSLRNLEVGSVVELTNDRDEVYHYQVINAQIVSPDEVSLVLPTDEEFLTIYTCTGWLDSKRLVFQAKPIK